MMQPISRIPLEDMTEMQLINSEPSVDSPLHLIVRGFIDHATATPNNDDGISITLDWAMQLRERTGQDWGTCIEVAITAFYG